MQKYSDTQTPLSAFTIRGDSRRIVSGDYLTCLVWNYLSFPRLCVCSAVFALALALSFQELPIGGLFWTDVVCFVPRLRVSCY